MTYICISNVTIIGSDNGLSSCRCQAIIWTNAGILSIGPLRTNFNEILIEIHTFSLKKMHLKMLSGNWQPFCLGLNELIPTMNFKYSCLYQIWMWATYISMIKAMWEIEWYLHGTSTNRVCTKLTQWPMGMCKWFYFTSIFFKLILWSDILSTSYAMDTEPHWW